MATGSLAAALKAGVLDEQGRLDAFTDIARGLMELAEASVLHRDLKPANVLELDGRWQLADFGLSRNLLERTGTYTFMGAGTVPYMAPELWQGQAASVKSDLYALGVLGFEVFTGARPFTGPGEADFRRQHQSESAPTPVGAPPSVDRLLLRLLAKDPAMRPSDARAVVEVLERAQMKLTSQQNELRQVALLSQQKRDRQEAALASAASAWQVARDLRTQVIADLQAILDDAADVADDALPEAQLVSQAAQWELRWEQACVTFVSWPSLQPAGASPGDPLIVAGSVYIENCGHGPSANIACEIVEGKFVWSLLRFTASAFVGNNYDFGPADKSHGFDQNTFANERAFMLHPSTHVWTMTKVVLTAECVVDLLREAIEYV